VKEKKKSEDNLIVIARIVLILIFSFLILKTIDQDSNIKELKKEIKDKDQTFELYYKVAFDREYNGSITPQGIYYNNSFCVWVEGKTHSQVMQTASHEYLHHLDQNCHFDSTIGCG